MKRSPVMIDAKEFGAKLREARIKSGKKQSELADAIGVAPNSVSYYEKGRSLPSLDLAVQIANFFQVSLDYLVGANELQQKFKALQFTDIEKIWMKELLEVEKGQQLGFAKLEHTAALGSLTNEESTMHETNSDNHRAYAHKLDVLITKVV